MKNVGPLKTKKTDKKKSAVEMAEEIFSGGWCLATLFNNNVTDIASTIVLYFW